MKISDLKISTRLAGGFGLVLVLLLAVAGIGYRNLNLLNDAVTVVTRDRVPKLLAAGEWKVNVLQGARHMRSVFILDGRDLIGKELEAVAEDTRKNQRVVDELSKTVVSPDGMAALKVATAIRTDYESAEADFIKIAASGDLQAAKQVLLLRVRPAQLKYIDAIEKFETFQKKRVDAANVDGAAALVEARSVMLGLVALALLAGAAVAWWLARGLSRQIAAALAVANAVEAGKLDNVIDAGGRDETAS